MHHHAPHADCFDTGRPRQSEHSRRVSGTTSSDTRINPRGLTYRHPRPSHNGQPVPSFVVDSFSGWRLAIGRALPPRPSVPITAADPVGRYFLSARYPATGYAGAACLQPTIPRRQMVRGKVFEALALPASFWSADVTLDALATRDV